jgi:hypothetical protein
VFNQTIRQPFCFSLPFDFYHLLTLFYELSLGIEGFHLGGANEGKILASFSVCEKGGEGKPCAAEGMDLIVIPPLFLWNLY